MGIYIHPINGSGKLKESSNLTGFLPVKEPLSEPDFFQRDLL